MEQEKKYSHRRFIIKSALLLSPFWITLIVYFLVNPFDILPYSVFPNDIAEKSTDVKFTRELLSNYKIENHNAFIFGNSRAGAYEKNFGDYFRDAVVRSLNTPGESIRNVYYKVKLVDSLGLKIKYAFVHMDDALIGNYNNSNVYLQGPSYIHHPLTAKSSELEFQSKGVGFFFAKFYFIPYIHYLSTHNYKPYMKEYFKDIYGANKLSLEEKAETGDSNYYKNNAALFPERSHINEYYEVKVQKSDSLLLAQIKNIFTKHHTNYKICFSITYQMKKMNIKVLNTFKNIFGDTLVYDFTGENSVAKDITNFYESSHFRTKAGKLQLDSIYLKNRFNN
jgi:hypothetical protein